MTIPLANRIIYHNEEAGLVVVNKPPHVASHGPCSTSIFGLDTLISLHLGIQCSPAHRLDRDTTGVLLMGTRLSMRRRLSSAFERRVVQKNYYALVHRRFPANAEVRARLSLSTKETPVQVVSEGDRGACEAITTFRLLDHFGPYSLVEAIPHTGRTHQIRVSLAYLGYPIVGDTTYYPDDTESFRRQDEQLTPPRYLLHAARIGVPAEIFPLSSNLLQAPLERDFAHFLTEASA